MHSRECTECANRLCTENKRRDITWTFGALGALGALGANMEVKGIKVKCNQGTRERELWSTHVDIYTLNSPLNLKD